MLVKGTFSTQIRRIRILAVEQQQQQQEEAVSAFSSKAASPYAGSKALEPVANGNVVVAECQGNGTSRARTNGNGNEDEGEGQVDPIGFGTFVSSNGVLYRQAPLTNGRTVSTARNLIKNLAQADADDPCCGVVVVDDPTGTSHVNDGTLDDLGKALSMRAPPQRVTGEACGAAYPVARSTDNYHPTSGRIGVLDEPARRITFVEESGVSCTAVGLYSSNGGELDVVKCESNGSAGAANQSQDVLENYQAGSGSVGRCDSVRSDTAESTYSSLSSPESQNQLQDAVAGSACAQQAVRSVTQHNVVLTMNGGAVTQRHQRPSISVPHGWKRICTNGVIIYISPSSTALGSLDQLKEYLTTAGTCKCGLECPLRPEQVFNFDPKVATRPWSPDQGKTREMTKLCNHKRKLLLPAAAASPVASCTPAVLSSTLSAGPPGPPGIHANSDSPTSSDKTKKDGLSKKKKRKLGSVGGLYSGVSVSQLLAQRERALAAAAASGVQGASVSNGPQVWPIAIPNLQVQQNNQQINHQSLNPPSQSHDINGGISRNSQQRLSQHNMTGMVMGNPLIMSQQGTNLNNMTQQQQQLLQQQHQQLILQQQQQQQLMQQHISQHQQHQHQQQQQQQQQLLHHQQMQHMQILHQQQQQQQQQEQQQQQQNIVANQMSQQQMSPYLNQLNQQSLHVMQQQQQQQQQHINQQQQLQQQIHLQQQIQKHNMAVQQQHVNQEADQQQSTSYSSQPAPESFVHHMQATQNPSQTSLHPQLQQFHQHQMQHQQQSNQHIMQSQPQEYFQMQIQQQQQQQQSPGPPTTRREDESRHRIDGVKGGGGSAGHRECRTDSTIFAQRKRIIGTLTQWGLPTTLLRASPRSRSCARRTRVTG